MIDGRLGDDFATVLLAVHDPATDALTYARAGHPAPLVTGASSYKPVTVGSSPPIGIGEPTGLRQTTLPLPPGSVALLYTDGVVDARTRDGVVGRERLAELLGEMGPDATAAGLLERVASEARLLTDDMAACVLTPVAGAAAGGFRSEQLELTEADLGRSLLDRFLAACQVPTEHARPAVQVARATCARFGGAVVNVVFGDPPTVEVVPRNVESIEASSSRASVG